MTTNPNKHQPLFCPGDFVKSRLDPFKCGLVEEFRSIGPFNLPGYMIRLADHYSLWIAEDDLQLIAPAADENN